MSNLLRAWLSKELVEQQRIRHCPERPFRLTRDMDRQKSPRPGLPERQDSDAAFFTGPGVSTRGIH